MIARMYILSPLGGNSSYIVSDTWYTYYLLLYYLAKSREKYVAIGRKRIDGFFPSLSCDTRHPVLALVWSRRSIDPARRARRHTTRVTHSLDHEGKYCHTPLALARYDHVLLSWGCVKPICLAQSSVTDEQYNISFAFRDAEPSRGDGYPSLKSKLPPRNANVDLSSSLFCMRTV